MMHHILLRRKESQNISMGKLNLKRKKVDEQKQDTKTQKRRKKLKRTFKINDPAEEGYFSIQYVLHDEPHILLAQIAQRTTRSVFVKACSNIDRCKVAKEKEKKIKKVYLQIAGVNFDAFWGLDDILDIKNISSNDIYAMLKTYGVEVARATIIKEVSKVFGNYSITVDKRHLNMIADFMTFDGGYRPMNRIGMGQYCTSPFGKMTFETATKFIVEAAIHGEVDALECPSASVCLGQPAKVGTGTFGLPQNPDLEEPMVM